MRHWKVPAGGLWVLGELFGSIRSEKEVADWANDPDPGRWPLELLNGHFLVVAHACQKDEWHFWTNRFGTLHAYHLQAGGRGAISTSYAALAEAADRGELDLEAIRAFWTFGFFPGNRTWFSRIRVLEPARHYVFDARLCLKSVRRYWHWSHQPDESRSGAQVAEQFGDLLREVMQDMTREGRVAVPISGGLDSRSTVAALPPDIDRSALWAYSYGYSKSSVENRLAAQVGRAAELPFTAFAIEPYLFRDLPVILGAVEGFQDVTQCRQASVRAELTRHANRVIAAHWGDVWCDDMGWDSTRRSGHEMDDVLGLVWAKVAKKGHEWLLAHSGATITRREPPKSENPQRAWLRGTLEAYGDIKDPDFRVKAWKTDHWSFRWTLASLRMFQAAVFPRLPYYDKRLVDFLLKLPTRTVAGRRLQIDFMKRSAPDLARVPWQRTGRDLFTPAPGVVGSLVNRVWNRTRRAWERDPGWSRNWEVQFGGDQGQAGLQHWLLLSGRRLHDLIPVPAIAELLRSFSPGQSNGAEGYVVSMLLTTSISLESYRA